MKDQFMDYFEVKVLSVAGQQAEIDVEQVNVSTTDVVTGTDSFGEELLTCIQSLPIKKVANNNNIVMLLIIVEYVIGTIIFSYQYYIQ